MARMARSRHRGPSAVRPPRPSAAAATFGRAAAWLAGGEGGWRVDQLRVERRTPLRVAGGRWLASSLLACVERPSRGGGPAPLLATAHVHLWGPRAARALPGPLREAAAAFAARGYGVAWDPANGRFGWVARPLLSGLEPLGEECAFLEAAFTAGGPGVPASTPHGPPAMAAAIPVLRADGWLPSALGAGRVGVAAPVAGGRLDLSLLLVGATGERRASDGAIRATLGATLWLPEEARERLGALRRDRALRALSAALRVAGYRARWHVAQAGPPFVRFERRVPAVLAALRPALRRLEATAAAWAAR
jgi:hypothetical protein